MYKICINDYIYNVLYDSILHTVLNTIKYCTYTIRQCIILYYTMLYYAIKYYTIQHITIQ